MNIIQELEKGLQRLNRTALSASTGKCLKMLPPKTFTQAARSMLPHWHQTLHEQICWWCGDYRDQNKSFFATRKQMRALRQGSKQQAGVKGKMRVCSATSFSHCPPMTAVRGRAQDSIIQCRRHQQTARGAHIRKGNHQRGREVHGEQSAAPCQHKEGADCWL